MTKQNLKVKREDDRITAEMEYAKWKVASANSFLNILGVNRPPDSSIPQFLDNFTELLVDIVASNTNLVILGDFNIHVNYVNDPNASIFLDIMTALGLKQHVRGPTHKSGNCLDLIFTEEMSTTKQIKCSQSLSVSDHNSIWCILNIPKEDCTHKEVTYRKLSEIDLAQLVDNMSLEMIKEENLDDMVAMLEENFSTALNNQAPEVTKVIKVRKKKPWFGNELKLQKRKVLRREKVFRKYRLQSCWIAFDSQRRKYRKMLMDAKIASYSAQVRNCRGDTKELYKLVNALMGTTSNNPLPNYTNDKDLADKSRESETTSLKTLFTNQQERIYLG